MKTRLLISTSSKIGIQALEQAYKEARAKLGVTTKLSGMVKVADEPGCIPVKNYENISVENMATPENVKEAIEVMCKVQPGSW